MDEGKAIGSAFARLYLGEYVIDHEYNLARRAWRRYLKLTDRADAGTQFGDGKFARRARRRILDPIMRHVPLETWKAAQEDALREHERRTHSGRAE